MPNQDLDATWKYHNGTKHSYLSLRAHPHFLDWENKPLLFKIYPTLEVTRLAKDFRQTGVSALSAISSPGIAARGKKIPTLDDIAQFLFFSAGVTRSKKFPGGETFFRAAAFTGALYEIELYNSISFSAPVQAAARKKVSPPGNFLLRVTPAEKNRNCAMSSRVGIFLPLAAIPGLEIAESADTPVWRKSFASRVTSRVG